MNQTGVWYGLTPGGLEDALSESRVGRGTGRRAALSGPVVELVTR